MNAATKTVDTTSYLNAPDNTQLEHIQGDYGIPVFGKAFSFIKDPQAVALDHYRRFGPISRIRLGNEYSLLALGPENTQAIYLDADKNFSSKKGFSRFDSYLGNSLIMRDFGDHKVQRRLMQGAFKTPAIKGYIDGINQVCRSNMSRMAGYDRFTFFPEIKATLLEIATKVFTGVDHQVGGDNDMLSKRFLDFVESFVYLFPVKLPGFNYYRGLKAKEDIAAFIGPLIEQRRHSDGVDMLSHFCREKDDDGNYFSNDTIIDNFILLLFAAQDTTTASLTNTLMELGQHPQWQQRLREESAAIGKAELDYDDFEKLPSYGLVFNEIQRLHPSVPLIPRRTIRDCELSGVEIPANTVISNYAVFNHRMPEWWSNPNQFDPGRFERGEHKQHPFMFHPFGGGAHKCIGMHFAQYVYKTFLHQLLSQYEIILPDNYQPSMQCVPMPKPRDNLPVSFIPLVR
jgi:cytochrome P450